MSAGSYGWLVLAFPLGGALLIALGWRLLPGRSAGWIASGAIFGSFLSAIGALFALLEREPEARAVTSTWFSYAQTAGLSVDMGLLIDPLSVFMALVVSGVSLLIHIYSVAYMASDRGYARYFAYLNLFVFSMLLLVLAGNLILLTVGWAFVGAASYLLISFWYRRKTATAAGMKAFVINVIGDVGLVIATFLLFSETGAVDYAGVFDGAAKVFEPGDTTLVIACLLLLVGAFAKSAQLPLHTWLPDAMEGPTPVSALIHAATMVTAGVYLIARTHPLFELAPTAADVAAIVGTLTLLFAATVALVATDLKRIIAYSTISQIGYMVLGVSAFAYSAGLFHLMTHAFFKALLFMAAGSVIAAMAGRQSIDAMGGLRVAMPLTFATFTAGALALAGAPLTSGFFSKDEVIAATLDRGGLYTVLAIGAYVGALLTALYAFRIVFRVFLGEPVVEARSLARGQLAPSRHENPATGEQEDTDVGFPGPEHHIAERERSMAAPMGALALLALLAGLLGVPAVTHVVDRFLEPTFADSQYIDQTPSDGAAYLGLAIGGALSLVGIAAAYLLYVRRPALPLVLRARFARTHRLLSSRWYFDELFDRLLVRPTVAAGRFGNAVVERFLVQGALVDGTSAVVRAGSSAARAAQTGQVRAYAFLLILGVSALVLYFLSGSV